MRDINSDAQPTRGPWDMSPDLSGQVALVTGAGRGIGRVIAHALGAAGAHVVVSARTVASIEAATEEIRAAGGQATPIPVDLASEGSVGSLFDRIRERWGRLDALVANAAIAMSGPLADFSIADFDALVAINLRGTFLCLQHALRLMMPQRRGYIIALSSIAGFVTYRDQSAYAATKHGLMGMLKGLALEAQEYGIRVSAIHPGGVNTEMMRANRPDIDPMEAVQPEDIARTVLFLLSLHDTAAIDQIHVRRRTAKPFP